MQIAPLARRLFARAASLALLPVLVGPAPAQENAPRPNILFALADDWGWPHAGVYGEDAVATPTFDRLAREGVLFERAFISSPSCTPSRNAIVTGQDFWRLGEGANLHSTLDVAHPNFMFLLRDAGYQIGHWRKAWGPGKFQAGGYEENPCGPGQRFDAFLKERDPDRPFCFWFGTSDPHRSFERDSGREAGIPLDAIRVPGFYPDHETVRGDMADYLAEVQRWDRDVGEALRLLEEAGELDNTLVVMTGDHGMPFPRCKGNLYDWGSRVPLAVRWPGRVQAGRRTDALVSLTDLAPTFLQAAGVAVPDVMTGRSLLPLLRGIAHDRDGAADSRDAPGWRDALAYGRERHTPAQEIPSLVGYPARALRTDRWLLILNLEPERWPMGVPENGTHPMAVHADTDNGPTKSLLVDHRDGASFADFYALCFAKRPAVELYDCRADPDQLDDLADDPAHADTVRRLRARLIAELEAREDPRFTDAPVRFDDYPYRAGYLQKRLDAHQEQ